MSTAASRGIRPCRRSKARRSSTVTTVSGLRAARAAMSITTAGVISSDSCSSVDSRPPSVKCPGASTWVPMCSMIRHSCM
jgi:hypothetical protein